jgi:preprotein translocase subunit YajC
MDTNAAIQFVVYIGIFFALIYFMMIRPQQKQRREHAELVDSLVPGDRVVSAGGIHGTVKVVTEDNVDLEVAPGIVITVMRQAINQKAEE